MFLSIDEPKSVLVLSPHIDDGELGCGGTINKIAGKDDRIFYAAFSEH